MGDARQTQSAIETLVSGAGRSVATQATIEVLLGEQVLAHATQAAIEVLYTSPPEGGGEVPEGTNPPAAGAVPTGAIRRLFFELKGGTPATRLLAAETPLSDPATWYGGPKPARLVSVSPISRELSSDGDFRGWEFRVLLADTDRTCRTLATTTTLSGAYAAIYLVADDVRYALGEPFRLAAGVVFDHGAKPGFQYEFIVRDILSSRVADLDAAPRIPPDRLALAEFPGMVPAAEGRAIPVVIGEASDEVTYAPPGPQGVVPAIFLGTVNFMALGSSTDKLVDAYIWSIGALAEIWSVYYNTPDTPDLRALVPADAYGVAVWTPGKPGWTELGTTLDYVDYNGRRYTPFFVDNAHPLAEAIRNGNVLIAGNLYGLAENGDGTGNYIDSAPRIWQWLIVNQLFVPYRIGDYAPVPTLDGTYSIIDTASVEAAHAALEARIAGGYVVGFLLGRDGQQQTLRHVLSELCFGTDLDQGVNRHGQAMLSVENPAAPAILTLSDLFDIEDGEFEIWRDREAFRNRLEHTYGFRYVPPSAPRAAPAEGAPLPKEPIAPYAAWTSGLVVREHAAAIAANGGLRRTLALENFVVRRATVATDLEDRLLARWVGPGPVYEGPLMFRLKTSWQGLGTGAAPIELGSVIAITHLEGLGPTGYEGQRGRVLKIEVDPQRARVTLEGRILGAALGDFWELDVDALDSATRLQ